MDIEIILKLAGVGMIVTVVCQLLSRAGRDEQATMVSLAGMVVMLLVLATKIGELITAIRGVFGI
jgi:stage III sporulation protein AC